MGFCLWCFLSLSAGCGIVSAKGGSQTPQFTKQAITASFLKLLAEKPLDRITVKDIVEDCGVSRNSFYYHYQDIFDLMDEVVQTETEKALGAHFDAASWQDALISALHFALSHKRQVTNMYRSSCRNRVEQYLFCVTEKVLFESVEELSKDLHTTEWDRRFLARFYTYALVGLFREWVEDGLPDDPETMIRRMGILLDGNIRSALIRSDPRNITGL